ncbi:MAG: hypothetical protein V4760_13250, partial [Bdellovibrionota bacterium]
REGEIGAEPSHPRMRVLRPFRKWGWLELPRLVPILMELQPEILHLIEPRAESMSGWTNAMGAIPSFAPLFGRPRVIVSFYDLSRETLASHRQILFSADLVTVSTRQQERIIEEWLRENGRRAATALVPLPSRTQRPISISDDETLSSLSSELSPALDHFSLIGDSLVLVPGDVSDHVDAEIVFSLLAETLRLRPNTRVLIAGGWGRTPVSKRAELMSIFERAGAGARVLMSGPLTPAAEVQCLERSRVVFMASLRGESLSLARWNREALEVRAPVVLSRNQCELDPLPWRDRETAFLVDDAGFDWGSALNEALENDELLSAIRTRLADFARSEVLDQPGNSMSRLYAQLLRP